MPKEDTQFKKGAAGRPKGVQNKLTKTVKETVLAVFNDIQDDPKVNLLKFAQTYPRDFYAIAAKLIPTEVNANVEVIKKELPPFMKSNESES
jgi:hypothetical protein